MRWRCKPGGQENVGKRAMLSHQGRRGSFLPSSSSSQQRPSILNSPRANHSNVHRDDNSTGGRLLNLYLLSKSRFWGLPDTPPPSSLQPAQPRANRAPSISTTMALNVYLNSTPVHSAQIYKSLLNLSQKKFPSLQPTAAPWSACSSPATTR